jgi:PadR family transcriptional regulator PadR
MSSARFPIPQGTLDMLVLHVLSLEAAHGYAIAQRVQQISRETVRVNRSRGRATSSWRVKRRAGIS